MTKAPYLLLLAASAILLPACNRADRDPASEIAQVDTAADESAIRAINQRWLELIRNKDAAGIAQLYAEDGAVMPANEKATVGRQAIGEWWNRSMQMPGFDLTFQTDQLVMSKAGDMALDRGTYRFAATPAQGAISDTGKYVVVWRKIGDEWKVAADIFNSDLPAAGG
ncbi:MAG TPA: DUF4440 domain-containing protein [Sphingomicrobium sp.]|nr:DUF4440 domain-containing protein [Sphingomicrobium sp.]